MHSILCLILSAQYLCIVFYSQNSIHSILCIVFYAQYLAQPSVQLIAPSEFRQQFWTRVLDQTIRLSKNMLKHFPKCNIGLENSLRRKNRPTDRQSLSDIELISIFSPKNSNCVSRSLIARYKIYYPRKFRVTNVRKMKKHIHKNKPQFF